MARSPSDAIARNHATYDDLWHYWGLFPHERWSSWPEIAPFVDGGARVLEIGPGKLPHLPIDRAWFVDLSMTALEALRAEGGRCLRATSPLPFADGTFDVVCLFEVLEHVPDDEALLDEIARVLRPGGMLFMSCPMNPDYWTYFDEVAGHERRYRAAELADKLPRHRLAIERSSARDDKMGIIGPIFGFGLRFFPWITMWITWLVLQKVAAMPWLWRDGEASLDEAERRGGVTLRARRLPDGA